MKLGSSDTKAKDFENTYEAMDQYYWDVFDIDEIHGLNEYLHDGATLVYEACATGRVEREGIPSLRDATQHLLPHTTVYGAPRVTSTIEYVWGEEGLADVRYNNLMTIEEFVNGSVDFESSGKAQPLTPKNEWFLTFLAQFFQ